MSQPTQLKFDVQWGGERAAGINPGSEEVTIIFKHGQPLDEDTINFWRVALCEFYDGAQVTDIISARAEKP